MQTTGGFMNSSIAVSCSENKGSEFTGHLKFELADAKELTGVSILLVKDAIVKQLRTKSVLTQHGAIVSTVSN